MEEKDSSQWLSNGDCEICRRSKYCSKSCRAKKEATQRDIYEVVNHLTSGFFGHMLKKQEELLRR